MTSTTPDYKTMQQFTQHGRRLRAEAMRDAFLALFRLFAAKPTADRRLGEWVG